MPKSKSKPHKTSKSEAVPKYVYTAHSNKQDGLLVITDKDWDEFAKSQLCRIVKLNDDFRYCAGGRLLVGKGIKLTRKDIKNIQEEGYCGFDIWFLYRSEIEVDENLASAVCW